MSGVTGPRPGVNPRVPSVARVYDFLLGGKDNFESDRNMAHKLLAVMPQAADTARANKEFGRRATDFMARQGIAQFIDLGSGIPTTAPGIHETARAVMPDATVVYVDNDPVVVAHSRALRAVAPGLATVQADIRDPEAVLMAPEMLAHIDFGRPVAVLLFSVLQTVPDRADPAALVGRFRDRMAAGSYVGLSHISTRSGAQDITHLHRIVRECGYPPVAVRSDDQVLEVFDGFDLVDPGLVDIRDWRPEERGPFGTVTLVGAVGRKR